MKRSTPRNWGAQLFLQRNLVEEAKVQRFSEPEGQENDHDRIYRVCEDASDIHASLRCLAAGVRTIVIVVPQT